MPATKETTSHQQHRHIMFSLPSKPSLGFLHLSSRRPILLLSQLGLLLGERLQYVDSRRRKLLWWLQKPRRLDKKEPESC